MRLTLGFKAFDAHELLCHFVAERAGLYREAGLAVELQDITFVPEEALPDHIVQVSCGAALTSALRGLPQKIVLVAVDRPMFWIWSREPRAGPAGLAGCRLATFPQAAPPYALANGVLRRAGLDPERDLRLMPARDDAARLGLLRSGNAEAAVISSAVPPARMAGLGFHRLCFIGDELRLPTTGLALDVALLERAPDAVRTLTETHRRALGRVRADRDLTAGVLREIFDIGDGMAAATAGVYAAAFTHDGRTTAAIAQGAIDAMGELLRIDSRPAWQDVYVFD